MKKITIHRCWESQSTSEFWLNEVITVGIKDCIFWDSQRVFLELFNILMEMQDTLEDWRLGTTKSQICCLTSIEFGIPVFVNIAKKFAKNKDVFPRYISWFETLVNGNVKLRKIVWKFKALIQEEMEPFTFPPK